MISPDSDPRRAACDAQAARPGVPKTLRERAVESWKEFRRFARGVLGSDAYDKYVHHHRITGCTHPLMTEREFWRAKYREQDENPGARCC